MPSNNPQELISPSGLTCYYWPDDQLSHRLRLMLRKKEASCDFVEWPNGRPLDDLSLLTPEGRLPILADRQISLDDAVVAMEYLEDRFPHPPLLPMIPAEKARIRIAAVKVARMWGESLVLLKNRSKPQVQERRREDFLRRIMLDIHPFESYKFYLSQTFTLLDCTVIPILWRLKSVGVHLPVSLETRGVRDYMRRVLDLEFVRKSFTDAERVLNDFDDPI